MVGRNGQKGWLSKSRMGEKLREEGNAFFFLNIGGTERNGILLHRKRTKIGTPYKEGCMVSGS